MRPRHEVNYRELEDADAELEAAWDGAAFGEVLQGYLGRLGQPRLTTLPNGDSLTLPWLRRHGLREPVLVLDKEGLGLQVPPPSFAVRDVARVCGESYPIEVLDVAKQSEVPGSWTLGDWALFYHTPPAQRKLVLNVITLEFSGLPLARLVRAPRFVRRIDWSDIVWPGFRRASGEYPLVQFYCLMSVGGAWTDFHLDFGGTSVWYHVHTGSKLFIFIPPTPEALAAYEAWIRSPSQGRIFFTDTLSEACRAMAFSVTLRAGQTLVIPSGYIHAVFTPEDSLVFGGNYLHGMAMDTQLRIYELELSSKVKKKYRFPYFEHIHWYAAAFYAQFTRMPQFSDVLQSVQRYSSMEGGGGCDEEEQQDAIHRVRDALCMVLDDIGLSLHEVRALPSLIKTLQHFLASLLSRRSHGGGGGGEEGGALEGAGGLAAGGGSSEVCDGSGASAPPTPASSPLKLVLKLVAKSASKTAAPPAATPAAAAIKREKRPRVKGQMGQVHSAGEDEYDVFPPSLAAAEAAAMAGCASPEELLQELSSALLQVASPSSSSSSSCAASSPSRSSLLAQHCKDDPRVVFPKGVTASLYRSDVFKRGTLFVHHAPLVSASTALAYGSQCSSLPAAEAAVVQPLLSLLASCAGEPFLPKCKLGLYGGSLPDFSTEGDLTPPPPEVALLPERGEACMAPPDADSAFTAAAAPASAASSGGGGGSRKGARRLLNSLGYQEDSNDDDAEEEESAEEKCEGEEDYSDIGEKASKRKREAFMGAGTGSAKQTSSSSSSSSSSAPSATRGRVGASSMPPPKPKSSKKPALTGTAAMMAIMRKSKR